MITSLQNSAVKEAAALLSKKRERDRQGLFVAEGRKLFEEAPFERISQVYLAESAEQELRAAYGEKLSRLPVEVLSDQAFAKLSDTVTPQGILCLLRQFTYNIEEMLWRKDEKRMLFILLEDMQDPGNLGTVFRTAEAAGADGVIMSEQTADVYSPKAVRATMGAVFRVPFLYTADLKAFTGQLRERGVRVYAAQLAGAVEYDACDYLGDSAFLVGNEGKGLQEETAACADVRVRIPMEGQAESLNAAVASSLLLYEAYRQRRWSRME